MKILVTGGTGFVGTHLCRALCGQGHKVIVFHRPTSYLNGIADLPLQRVVGDLTDEPSVQKAMELRPEVVYHLGAQMTVGNLSNRLTNVNVYGTRLVLRAAGQFGVNRVVLMSSALTMGIPDLYRGGEISRIDETHPFTGDKSDWAFAYTKYRAEQEAQPLTAEGLDVVTVNPFMIIGSGDYYRRSSSILQQLRRRPPLVNAPGGLNLLPVQDAVAGLLGACRYGQRGERYLLCGKNLTISEFLRMVSETAGFSPPRLTISDAHLIAALARVHTVLYPSESNIYRLLNRWFYYNPAKSRLQLHLPPLSDVSESIREAYRWFEEQK